MNILVLQGSPRPMTRSNTYSITEAFLKGLGEGHKIDVIDVLRRNVKPCLGCFGCWHKTPGHCIQHDDMDDILPLFIDADLVIWSLPLYYYGMPSHVKALMDRTLPLAKGDIIATENGRGAHPLRYALHFKTVLISTSGFPGANNNFEALQRQFEICYCGGFAGKIFVPEGELLKIKEAEPFTAPMYARAEAAGREFLANGCLSAETEQAFTQPMIPFEEYAKQGG